MNEKQAPSGLVRCEITNKLDPEEDIVTIQGYRVCAEGKAELLDRLKRGDRPPGVLDRPSVQRRFGGMFLDGLIFGVVYMVVTISVLGTMTLAPGPAPGSSAVIILWQLIYSVITAAYFVLMHGRYGQTLGKMAARIKVVRHDGGNIGMGTSALRYIYFQGPALLGTALLTAAFMLDSPPLEVSAAAMSGLSSIYVLISGVLAALDRDQQRAIHDRLAMTRVVALE
jgi:uncharacterized RDD family membrane protein YckC